MKPTTRREALKRIAWFSAAITLDGAFGQSETDSNFKAIYQNPVLKESFLLFLTNVYGLYPPDQLHQLIEKSTASGNTDKEIYQKIQSEISTITPYFSDLRFFKPTVLKHKDEMRRETLDLLGNVKTLNGYMEIGSVGRYLEPLRTKIKITGDVVLVDAVEPGFSLTDIIERGQLTKAGRYVSLKNYAPITPQEVPDASLDMVANYNGIHHSPADSRDNFVRSIHRVLRPGGRLILREHDVNSADMNHLVALAHDVSNVGRGISWDVNQKEIRNFTNTLQLVPYLDKLGLKLSIEKGQLLQPGDPTRNALLEFIKV